MSLPVTITNLTKRFNDHVAVNDISLTIPQGQLFFLLGPSGCGKTTLLRSVAGFAKPEEGTIHFGDKDITNVAPHKRNCGFVFQNYALWPHMTVFDNVAYGLNVRKMTKADVQEKVQLALKMVRLETLCDRKPTQLSGGQQQRVALARALVITPDVLLLDEPLSNLDAKLRLEMRDEIRRIHSETGITTIYVTHEQKEALSLAQQVAIMNLGKIEQLGAPKDLYFNPANEFVANFIGETNMLKGSLEDSKHVCLPFGTLEVPIFSGPTEQDVKVSVRPESVRIHSSKKEGKNIFSATVENAIYLGEHEQVCLNLSDGTSLKVLAYDPGGNTHHEGESVWLEIPSTSVRVFAS